MPANSEPRLLDRRSALAWGGQLLLAGASAGAFRGAPAQQAAASTPTDPHSLVRGIVVSCGGVGQVWGTDSFAAELDVLVELGCNWVQIHPYAGFRRDGEVTHSLDPADPPLEFVRPIREAHARGLKVLVKPHLAYWGTGFSWRGEVDFEGGDRERFWRTYTAWVTDLARITGDADAFCVGTELDRLLDDDRWREIIAAVRAEHDGHLTYAPNWTDVERVGFWDALDCIGVQAYYPLSERSDPTPQQLRRGWRRRANELFRLHRKTGKPVVFTELGYSAGPLAAREPWVSSVARAEDAAGSAGVEFAQALQLRCYEAAQATLDEHREWLRGAFLWKWFCGGPRSRDFRLQAEHLQPFLRERFGARS
ncbi:MAG: glycoside hydrolase family 113 [Planctomycetota bacterium]|jgi:hypothetical protein